MNCNLHCSPWVLTFHKYSACTASAGTDFTLSLVPASVRSAEFTRQTGRNSKHHNSQWTLRCERKSVTTINPICLCSFQLVVKGRICVTVYLPNGLISWNRFRSAYYKLGNYCLDDRAYMQNALSFWLPTATFLEMWTIYRDKKVSEYLWVFIHFSQKSILDYNISFIKWNLQWHLQWHWLCSWAFQDKWAHWLHVHVHMMLVSP